MSEINPQTYNADVKTITIVDLKLTPNQLEKGLDTLRRAYAVNSEDPTIQYHIAATLEKLGKKEEAKEELIRNNTLEKTFPDKADAEALFKRLD